MRKYKKEEHKYITDVVSEVMCDKCGKQIELPREKYTSIISNTIWNSLRDDDPINVDLCNDCSREFMNSLKSKLDKEPLFKTDIEVYYDPEDDFMDEM